MMQGLDDVLAQAFACLAEGATASDSVWHTLTLANIDIEGFVSQRSVVVRGWDSASRCLEIHTDTRSAKVEALRRDARASVHGWDARRRVQLRVRGAMELHSNDPVAQAAWVRLRPSSRATYTIVPGPGTILRQPGETSESTEMEGYVVFCVLRLTVCELEWLHLEQGSYARARFCWDNSVARSMWLVP
jgi:pyridoxamine 5'-phosphate oxidase